MRRGVLQPGFARHVQRILRREKARTGGSRVWAGQPIGAILPQSGLVGLIPAGYWVGVDSSCSGFWEGSDWCSVWFSAVSVGRSGRAPTSFRSRYHW